MSATKETNVVGPCADDQTCSTRKSILSSVVCSLSECSSATRPNIGISCSLWTGRRKRS